MRFGIAKGSGLYSLVLLFLVCRMCGLCTPSRLSPWTVGGASPDDNPAYGFLILENLVGVADASSAFSRRTSSLTAGECWCPSRERRRSCLHGPGECVDRRGEGRGVTSPIADITGLGTVELAAEAELKAPDKLPVALKLGVLEIGQRDEVDDLCWRGRPGRFEVLQGVAKPLVLSGLRGDLGRKSVCSLGALSPRLDGR